MTKQESRSPCGERGLKFVVGGVPPPGGQSLPVRGAWVEMPCTYIAYGSTLRRSPCGERGLKSKASGCPSVLVMSLPVRGAWVEIAP